MNQTLDGKLSALTELSQNKLLNILNKIHGSKDFIIDTTLMKPLDKIVGVTKLRAGGVDKIYKLNDEIPCTNSQRVFLINADLITMKRVCDKINAELGKKPHGTTYHVVLVSRVLISLQRLLEEEGLFGLVNLHAFQWDLIPVGNRVLSLEFNNLYKMLFIDGDQSLLATVARSIWTLHMLLGQPYITLVQGKFSHFVDRMVQILYDELGEPDTMDRDISCFLIVDRDIDYPSTLLTGASYLSLLDEVFGIKCGSVEITNNGNPTNIVLNSTEEIFSQIKNRHFSDVFPYLNQKCKEITAAHSKSQKMHIAEIKQFISTELSLLTNTKKSLAHHISACESIIGQKGQIFEGLKAIENNMILSLNRKECINYIEECLSMNIIDRYSILRLICLLSVTQDGLTHDELIKFKTLFLQVYGYQYLPVFHYLEQANLCVELPAVITTDFKGGYLANKVAQAVPLPTRKSAFTAQSQKLKLFPDLTDDYDLKHPKDPSYVFGGTYIPVVCQLVHLLAKNEQPPEEIAKLIPNCKIKKEDRTINKIRSIVVYFIGGVTYAEISALQLLETLTNTQIIVAGTSIINGNSLMKSFF